MTQPFRQPPVGLPLPATATTVVRPKVASTTASQTSVHSHAGSQVASPEHDETSSDHDVESVSGDSGVDSSWVSLNGSQTDIRGDAAV